MKKTITFALFLLCALATTGVIAKSDEITLFNSKGKPVAYIAAYDDYTIYLWKGKPVAYLDKRSNVIHIYNFEGKHLGWFKDGIVIDHSGNRVGFVKGAVNILPQFESFKGFRQFKPLKGLKELPPLKPLVSSSWSSIPLETFLVLGEGGKGSTGKVIESRIDGDFEGFEGETIFKLTNGQIWQQSEYYYHYHYSYMPEVLIYKSGGSYKMKVEGVKKAVGVYLLAAGGRPYPSITPLIPSSSATQGKTGSRSVIIAPKQPTKSKTPSRPALPTIRPTGGKVYHLSNSRLFHRRDCKAIQGKTNLGEFSSRGKTIKGGGIPCKLCNP